MPLFVSIASYVVILRLFLSAVAVNSWRTTLFSRRTGATISFCRRTGTLATTRHFGNSNMFDVHHTGNSKTSVASSKEGVSEYSIHVLGVCGGIGSGKSVACELLVSELNCLAHIDSDSIAHSVYEPGSQAIQDVVDTFGPELLIEETGDIDRKRLGSIVFADSEAMRRLERIVWPHVRTKIWHRIEEIKSTAGAMPDKKPIIILEAAVLLDAGWEVFLDGVWVIHVSKDMALQRLQTNRGMSFDDAAKRVEAQQARRGIGNLKEEVNNGIVTAVIDNAGTLEDLKQDLLTKLSDTCNWYPNQ
jgi:dephospho-CoA kinase